MAMFIFGAVILWGGAIYFLWRSMKSKNNMKEEETK
ncbi:MetS family NSS transporter small subunit [Methanocaldococcus sp. 10A]